MHGVSCSREKVRSWEALIHLTLYALSCGIKECSGKEAIKRLYQYINGDVSPH